MSSIDLQGAGSDWTSIGPNGGTITVLALDPAQPRTLYAGIEGRGIFRSGDGGHSWIQRGLEGHFVRELVIDPSAPQTLYAITVKDKGGIGGGLYKSTDSGIHWKSIDKGIENASLTTLAINPLSSETLFAGASGGIFKSTDGGESWRASDTTRMDMVVGALVVDPVSSGTVYAGTFPTGIEGEGLGALGVLKSTDGGDHWTPSNTGLTNMHVCALVIDPVEPKTLYAGTWGGVDRVSLDEQKKVSVARGEKGGIFKSTDGGAHWTMISTELTEHLIDALVIDPASPGTMYAGAMNSKGGLSYGLYKSTDGGKTWSGFSTGQFRDIFTALAMDPGTRTVYIGTSCCGVIKGSY